MLTEYFSVLAIGSRHFEWIDNLRRHINVDEIIRLEMMSERDAGKGNWHEVA